MDIKIESHVGEAIAISDGAIRAALESCGLLAEGYGKAMCPVDTGRLRNSITHEVDKTVMMVGTNVDYAPYVEMGTKKMGAKPYIKPSIENHIAEYKSIIEQALK